MRSRPSRAYDPSPEWSTRSVRWCARTDHMCYGCVWESIVKPLVLPLVGWERGYPPRAARDPDPDRSLKVISGADLLADYEQRQKTRVPATTDTERWLRTPEAHDAVTDTLLERLERADPGGMP